MCSTDLKAASSDCRFTVILKKAALSAIRESTRRAKNCETGGILIGMVENSGQAIVVEATSKPKGSIFTWRSFLRKRDGLESLLKSRWEQNLYYLGEWHSHPGGSPVPSEQDRTTMRGIATSEDYRCSTPILVILGTAEGLETLSVTVFPKGERDVALDIGQMFDQTAAETANPTTPSSINPAHKSD